MPIKFKLDSPTPYLLLAALYFVSGKLALHLAFLQPSATPVWPCTGIALAALLLFGYRLWPAIFVAAFFVNLATAGTVLTSFSIATGILWKLSPVVSWFPVSPTGATFFSVRTIFSDLRFSLASSPPPSALQSAPQ